MNLRDRLLKNSTIDTTSILDKSITFNEKDTISTKIPAINIALSSYIDGGLTSGLLQIAGPSRHFKSAFTFIMASSYLNTYDDAIVLFYDSEFGTPKAYFTSLNIDMSRVIHTPITNIEEFKNDLMVQLENLTREDHVIIVVDSIGNLASKKEVDDALDEKTVVDMTRAKALKSLGRMITPHLSLKDIPMVAVNHVYSEMSLFPKQIVGGGQGLFLSSDNIWIVGRQQEKDSSKEKIGYNFIINIEKSRYVKEGSKIPITVTFEGGIDKNSGLFEMALGGGFIQESSKGYYTTYLSDGKMRRSEIEKSDFLTSILSNDDFKKYVHETYSINNGKLIED